eukprot:366433-Chlamydomonas_euryale.AAC.1
MLSTHCFLTRQLLVSRNPDTGMAPAPGCPLTFLLSHPAAPPHLAAFTPGHTHTQHPPPLTDAAGVP